MLHSLLQKIIQRGRLRVKIAGGALMSFGNGEGPEIAVRITPAAAAALALNPDLKFGECFMDGDLAFESGDMFGLLQLLALNLEHWDQRPGAFERMAAAAGRALTQINGRTAARRNVAHHYDLSHDLYRRFLDTDFQYSCAYFLNPDDTLEEAQSAKKRHIAAKLALYPGARALDIGCGWGGLALTLGEMGARVTGLTLSREQLKIARSRAAASGLGGRVDFLLRDYRDQCGPYDRIVSVGMFEHVGTPNYQKYFDTIARLLADDGVAVIHSIGRRAPPGVTQPFIAKYIFPGGYIPALSEVLPAIERSGLWVTDIEILRLHYADTLRHWRARFEQERSAIAKLYDERFCRMWEFYLASSEAGFRWFGMMNFQIQLTKSAYTLPTTRDYITTTEHALTMAETRPHAAE